MHRFLKSDRSTCRSGNLTVSHWFPVSGVAYIQTLAMSLDLKTNLPQINLRLVKSHNCLLYSFEDFQLDAEHLMLYRDGVEISLTPKQVETLLALIESNGTIVSKEALMARLWGDSSVEESNLIQNIHVLRKVVGDTVSGKPMFETLRRRGYRFNGEVKLQANGRDNTQIVQKMSRRVETDAEAPQLPGVTKRRKGLLRGFKILLSGIGVGFVFLVLLQALWVFGSMLSQYGKNDSEASGRSTQDTIEGLAVMLVIPVALGWFTGIGLFLFGIGRLAYALFERENSRINSLTVERVMAGVICLLLLAVAIPNLIYSFREANRVRNIQQALTEERSVAVLPIKRVAAGDREEIYEYGIPESVIAKINTVKGFTARPLNTMIRRYAELEQDPFAAGRDLKVDYVLTSNYQVAEGQISATWQLLNVSAGVVEDTFVTTADSADAISSQEIIATYVADKFLGRFGSRVGPALETSGTTREHDPLR